MNIELIEQPDWTLPGGHPEAFVSHSRAWWNFLAETQRVTPVVLKITADQGDSWFVGGRARKFPIQILGSPFPGWSTSYTGFLGGIDRLAAIRAVAAFAFRELGVAHIECLDPRMPVEAVRAASLRHRIFQNFLLDLTVTPQELQAGLAKNAKGSLTAARQRGVTVTLDPPDDQFTAVYYQQLETAFARQGLRPSYPAARVEALLRHLRPSGLVMTGWSQDEQGTVVATNISTGNHQRAALWGAAFNRDFARLQPTELLQWEIIRAWQERGTRSFDFGGAGEYKRKYGGIRIETPYVRISKYPPLEWLRQRGMQLQAWRQRQNVRHPGAESDREE